jgi:hypothetical protein
LQSAKRKVKTVRILAEIGDSGTTKTTKGTKKRDQRIAQRQDYPSLSAFVHFVPFVVAHFGSNCATTLFASTPPTLGESPYFAYVSGFAAVDFLGFCVEAAGWAMGYWCAGFAGGGHGQRRSCGQRT